LLEQSRSIPLSSQRIVNADEFSQLIERMRISVPSSIRESERTLAERDAIIADAHAEAQKVIEQANQRAREILSDNSLVQAAQREADRIIFDSREQASHHAKEADRYATGVLEELAEKLNIVSRQVENGIRMLQDSALPGTEVDDGAGDEED